MKSLRVYLSSTFEDLKVYRAGVFAALERAGLDVARMEAYTAADERPLDLCLRDVARSDVYVGLCAWRYGYVPPAEHGNPDGRSITELEYRKAETDKLRKLLFFAHPDTKAAWPERFKDEATGESESGNRVAAFRKELGTEKTASFFRAPDELATLVLAAIMRSGLSGRPYNLPSRPTGFVSRPKLTQDLARKLVNANGHAAGHTLVQGAGGFGKTSLCIDACHRAEVVNAFPGGMLWVALGEQQPDLALKMSNLHVVATGGPPAVAGLDAITDALAKALRGRRCLVVIDDVFRVEDLEPFLRLDGARLLVTTRIRTLVEQARETAWSEILVDEMEVEEAAALLGRGLALDDPTRQTLEEFSNRLGCWPLLLDLANARLLEERKTRRGGIAECIDHVVRLFAHRGVLGFDRHDTQARNAAVANSVAVGLELADKMFPDLARKAAELAVFPEDVPIPVVVLADLWKMDEIAVEEEAVRPLDNLSILTWDRDASAIRLHDMIRLALQARVAIPVAVHRRLIDVWGDLYHLPHDYAWRWFAWHCARAEERARLQRALLDFDWLRAKLEATEINALVADFDCLQSDPQAQLLQSALWLSAHVLGKARSKLAGQLLARVPERERELRDRILERSLANRDPWLRPLRPSLTPPGGALLRTFEEHTFAVFDVALTQDGRRAVSASMDDTLKVWDIERGEVLHTLEGHASSVLAVDLMVDATHAVSASSDGTLRVWDLRSGDLQRTLEEEGASPVLALALTPDGKRAVSARNDGTLKVWDLASPDAPPHTLEGHTGWVSAVALTPDGNQAVSASWDRTLKVWDLTSGKVLRTLVGHTETVADVALTPDGNQAVSASWDRTLKVWDLTSGKVLRTLEGHTDWINAVALTRDGKRAVSGGKDRTLRLWDLSRGEALHTIGKHSDAVNAVALLPDGKRVVSASDDRTLRIWDLERGEARATVEAHTHWVTALALTPDGRRVVSASADHTLKIWDVARCATLRTLEGHTDWVVAVTLTRDGKTAVSASRDGTLRVWNLEREEAPRTLKGHEDGIHAVVLTPDGKRAVSASRDHTLIVWNLQQGDIVCRLTGHDYEVYAAHLTPDGKRVVSVSQDCSLRVWTLEGGPALHTLEGHGGSVFAAALTPGGKTAVSAGNDGKLRVWDIEQGVLLRTLEGHGDRVHTVAVTRDGKRAISGSADHTLKVWDLELGRVLHTLEGHSDGVGAVTLTPDDRTAISTSSDRTVAVWNMESGELVASFGGDSVFSTAIPVPDGRTIVVGDEEGRVHFLWLENASF